MLYIAVLFGSFAAICTIFGTRIALQNRKIRTFVRCIKHRSDAAEKRTPVDTIERPAQRSCVRRTMGVQVQGTRALQREAEKLLARREYQEAERLFIQALTIDPHSYEVREDLAKLYLTTHRFAKTIALYKELLQERPVVDYFRNLGYAYEQQGTYGKAAEAYASALELQPASEERQYDLGRMLALTGCYADAAPLLEKASTRLSRDTDLLRLLAQCYEHIDADERAGEVYQRLHRLLPYDRDLAAKVMA